MEGQRPVQAAEGPVMAVRFTNSTNSHLGYYNTRPLLSLQHLEYYLRQWFPHLRSPEKDLGSLEGFMRASYYYLDGRNPNLEHLDLALLDDVSDNVDLIAEILQRQLQEWEERMRVNNDSWPAPYDFTLQPNYDFTPLHFNGHLPQQQLQLQQSLNQQWFPHSHSPQKDFSYLGELMREFHNLSEHHHLTELLNPLSIVDLIVKTLQYQLQEWRELMKEHWRTVASERQSQRGTPYHPGETRVGLPVSERLALFMPTIDGLPVKPDNEYSHSGTEMHTQQFASEGQIGLSQQPAFPVCNEPSVHTPQDNVTSVGQLSDYTSANYSLIHSNATPSRLGTDPGSQYRKAGRRKTRGQRKTRGRAQDFDKNCPLLTLKPPNAKTKRSCEESYETVSKLRGHVFSVHWREFIYCCPGCGINESKDSNLIRHITSDTLTCLQEVIKLSQNEGLRALRIPETNSEPLPSFKPHHKAIMEVVRAYERGTTVQKGCFKQFRELVLNRPSDSANESCWSEILEIVTRFYDLEQAPLLQQVPPSQQGPHYLGSQILAPEDSSLQTTSTYPSSLGSNDSIKNIWRTVEGKCPQATGFR